MPMRNLFRKSELQPDENQRPPLPGAGDSGFQKTDVVGSKPASTLSIKSTTSNQQPPEYKLSEINDSGVYLPPSPTEKQSFWQTKTNGSTASSNHRSVLAENEPFNISRESFDSYRRSFDISARSPIIDSDRRPRQSLDTQRLRLPSAAVTENQQRQTRPPAVDEDFEDVGLHDDPKPKKRSIFSRFGDSADNKDAPTPADGKHSGQFGTHLFGRKRGQSGQGAELGNMKRPDSSHRPGSSHAPEVKVDR